MAEQTNFKGVVKRNTMLLIALAALVTGFLGGVFYGSLKMDKQTVSSPVESLQQQSQFDLSDERAKTIISLEQEVAANPTNVNAWIRLGNLYYDTKNYPKAINAYEKSLELSPDNPGVLTDLGTMYRYNDQPEKALEAYNRAIAVNPNHEQSRYNKGLVLYFNLNDRDGAMKAWKELLNIHPDALKPNGEPVSEYIKRL